jgi:UDP-N-acetylmuramoyl-tripeptide--D-alanyl-D-alanine ligase
MTPRPLTDLAVRLGAQIHAHEAQVTGFATDNREVRPGDLFLAICGSRVDGHSFAQDAMARGASACLVERPVDEPYLLVDDLVTSLARMAASFRDTFTGPVVGITGSVGKTTAKDLTAAALSPLGPVLKSEGNRNTEYTSPLVWAELEPEHRAVVMEMGMRGFGQIAHLASFSRPTIGTVTNVGFAHLELVGTREGIARAKAELVQSLPVNGVAVLWAGDDFLDFLRSETPARTATFGFEPDADCALLGYRAPDWHASYVEGRCHGERWCARLPSVGRHVALSAAAAVLAAAEAGVDPRKAAEALADARLAPMRMEVIEREGVRILLDTYNAGPPSMAGALETFSELPVSGRRLAVIGEMRELGEYTEEAHRRLGEVLAGHSLDAVVFFGAPTRWTLEAAIAAGMAEAQLVFAESIEEVRQFVVDARPGDAVLIKGSRSLELERAVL